MKTSEIIKEWKNWTEENIKLVNESEDFDYFYLMAMFKQALQELSASIRWIPVIERLPAVSGEYLCVLPWGTRTLYYDAGYKAWLIINGDIIREVSYWQELLEGPEQNG